MDYLHSQTHKEKLG